MTHSGWGLTTPLVGFIPEQIGSHKKKKKKHVQVNAAAFEAQDEVTQEDGTGSIKSENKPHNERHEEFLKTLLSGVALDSNYQR